MMPKQTEQIFNKLHSDGASSAWRLEGTFIN